MSTHGGRLFWALVLVGAGTVLLLNNLGLADIPLRAFAARYWPVLLIAWGAAGFVEGLQRGGQRPGGPLWGPLIVAGVAALLGALLLAGNLGWVEVSGWRLWRLALPLVLILLGFGLLRGSLQGPRRTFWAVMGGIKLDQSAWQPDDLAIVAVMGGAKLDLTGASAGVDLLGQPASGLMVERRAVADAAGPRVRIRSRTLLGGLKVVRAEPASAV